MIVFRLYEIKCLESSNNYSPEYIKYYIVGHLNLTCSKLQLKNKQKHSHVIACQTLVQTKGEKVHFPPLYPTDLFFQINSYTLETQLRNYRQYTTLFMDDQQGKRPTGHTGVQVEPVFSLLVWANVGQVTRWECFPTFMLSYRINFARISDDISFLFNRLRKRKLCFQQYVNSQQQNFLCQSAAHQNLSAVSNDGVPKLLITENDTSYKSNIYNR